MDTVDRSAFPLKREPDFSPGLGFQSSTSIDKTKEPSAAPFDMDFSSFLGGDCGGEQGTTAKPGELETSELNALLAADSGLLDFLDPTTGMPTPMKHPDNNGFLYGNNAQHPAGLPGNINNGNGSNCMPSPTNSSVQNGSGFEEDRGTWLVEQSQKLERQQALHQQKLLELEQTLLKTEILKNRLEIVSNLKHASPTIQTQLLNALGTMPDRAALSTVSQKVQLAATLSSSISTVANPQPLNPQQQQQQQPPAPPVSRIPSVSMPCSTTECLSPAMLQDDMTASTTSCDDEIMLPGGKKKSHNLIEKKYRTSINDRIGILRSIVSHHFKNDKKVQKSAVLQKTIDYIRYLENSNRKLREENKQLRTIIGTQANGYPLDSVGSSPMFPNSESSGDEDRSGSPDVFLSDSSPNCSPTVSSSHYFQTHPSTPNNARLSGRVFMCLILVICFFADPFSLSGGQLGGAPAAGIHGSQRILNSVDADEEGVVTIGWALMWMFRCLMALLFFGVVWVYSIPRHNPNWEGMRFWRLRKQAELDIKKSDFALAQIHLVSALTEVGLPLPTSYTSLALSLIWNGLSHILFQLFIGRIVVGLVSGFISKWKRLSLGKETRSKDAPLSVNHSDIAQTLHLLHQISLAEYDGRTMHGEGFYLGLTTLNYGEVGRQSISESQWCDMLFTMGVQCQFSCVCITSLLARYYFVCAGNLGGLLSFASTDDGWEFLMSREWTRDTQVATQHYKGVSVFPKYSITRSFCRALLTEAYRDLLLPHDQNMAVSTASSPDLDECLKIFQTVRDISQKTNGFMMDDIQRLTGSLPTLSDTLSTRECGFETLLWWSCVGLVACHWSKDTNSKQCEELYPIIIDLQEKSSPIPTALHLAFKAQHLHRNSSPPVKVLNQLCLTASQSLNDCGQKINTEDSLNLLGLLLACDWLLSLEYSLWEEQQKKPEEEEEITTKQITTNFRDGIDMLSHLTSLLPGAFPLLSKYKGYQRLLSGGNPLLAKSFLVAGGVQLHDNIRRRDQRTVIKST